ncbi:MULTISPECIES: hypothetical protein [Romboutsia]|uniref:Prokaryotic membrane lipoprotein lipid attachment site profile n=1 Tax=Romboutsia hominis TaxID=1507512 RepID=A0A2P2BRB4_9FIRM|nr:MULTISPECIES: hypothetical protein [Romboutsia]MCH1960239.1 hypothetical protein [Romboutsia hominis]MCH1969326.1 hypothetical protein [Romboutsia hominis]MDB8804981.1 hypothetical protein [Romboutsia sp. 1001216sp1]MDB8807971.1 hypothetical protein [Romboutsia sp. 1001216sp1]MDB8810626.1 hypothetical protein [Romboutsia sp. 1001216sp1]
MKCNKKIISLIIISLMSLGIVACDKNDIQKDQEKAVSNVEEKSDESIKEIDNMLSEIKNKYKDSVEEIEDKVSIDKSNNTNLDQKKISNYTNKILSLDDMKLRDIENKLTSIDELANIGDDKLKTLIGKYKNNLSENLDDFIKDINLSNYLDKEKELQSDINSIKSKIENTKENLTNVANDKVNKISDSISNIIN